MDSSHVRLEVAILSADGGPEPIAPSPREEPQAGRHLTIMVVAAADVRQYVLECLRDSAGTRVVEAASVSGALSVAAESTPDLVIVDAVVLGQSQPESALQPDIVLVDDIPRDEQSGHSGIRFVARPFSPQQLVAAVDRVRGRIVGS